MADDVDNSDSAHEQEAEPWAVWMGQKNEEAATPPQNAALSRLPLAVGLALASVALSLIALGSGHSTIPLWLILGHIPYFLILKRDPTTLVLLFDGAFLPKKQYPPERTQEIFARLRVWAESGKAAPELVSEGYRPVAPVLLDDTGIEAVVNGRVTAWDRFATYQWVGENEKGLIVRLSPAGSIKGKGGRRVRDSRRFWVRFALAVPFLVSGYAFLVGLGQHGWRVDTIAAFCAFFAHVTFRRFFRAMRAIWNKYMPWSEIDTDQPVYLIFDKRVVTLSDALTRLNRHLPATTEIV